MRHRNDAHFKTKKHLGQHLLIDPFTINRIVSSMTVSPDDHFIEIGPGTGAITDALLEKSKSLCAIEIDPEAITFLNQRYQSHRQFSLIANDVLKTDLSTVFGEEQFRVAGNLPYYLSSPIIFHLMSYSARMKDAHIMVQKEVADRIVASPGSKSYGRLTLGVRLYCEAEILFDIAPEAFRPPPKVQSSIVRLLPKKQSALPANPVVFENVAKQSFMHRRKKLSNNLKKLISTTELESLGIDPNCRAEELTFEQYVNLARFMEPL